MDRWVADNTSDYLAFLCSQTFKFSLAPRAPRLACAMRLLKMRPRQRPYKYGWWHDQVSEQPVCFVWTPPAALGSGVYGGALTSTVADHDGGWRSGCLLDHHPIS